MRSVVMELHVHRPAASTAAPLPGLREPVAGEEAHVSNKNKVGNADRNRVSAAEKYEADALAKKYDWPAPPVRS